MRFTMQELQIFGVIAKNADTEGWYTKGALFLAKETFGTADAMKKTIRHMVNDGLLEARTNDLGKIAAIRLTKKCNTERVRMFMTLFPDVKNVLLLA